MKKEDRVERGNSWPRDDLERVSSVFRLIIDVSHSSSTDGSVKWMSIALHSIDGLDYNRPFIPSGGHSLSLGYCRLLPNCMFTHVCMHYN